VKRPMLLTVRGKASEWTFRFRGDPAHLDEWQKDGLEVYECAASVPVWAADLGLAGALARLQRAWQWLRVW
jgi:hypothetical protein